MRARHISGKMTKIIREEPCRRSSRNNFGPYPTAVQFPTFVKKVAKSTRLDECPITMLRDNILGAFGLEFGNQLIESGDLHSHSFRKQFRDYISWIATMAAR